MKIAFIGSLPPHKDGIADHNFDLLLSLAKYNQDNLYIVTDTSKVDSRILKVFKNKIFSFKDVGKISFDVVHLQFGNSFPNSFVFKVFNEIRLKNNKIIVTLHDTTNTNIAKILRTLRSDPSKIMFELNRPKIKDIVNRADKIIVYSNFLKNYISEKYRCPNKIIVSKIGASLLQINNKSLLKKKYEFDKNDLIITTFGFITPRKGYEAVIKSLAMPEFKKIKFKYLIMGNFNFTHYKIYLKYLVNKLRLNNKVIFTGYFNKEKIEEILVASDIIIQPRLYSNEGASATLATALASGNSVITSKVGGLSEYVTHNVTGLLVPHNSIDYKESILLLYKDQKLREKLSRNAVEWTEKNLSWDIIAKKHLAIYKNLKK